MLALAPARRNCGGIVTLSRPPHRQPEATVIAIASSGLFTRIASYIGAGGQPPLPAQPTEIGKRWYHDVLDVADHLQLPVDERTTDWTLSHHEAYRSERRLELVAVFRR
jgi:hypothetical protein